MSKRVFRLILAAYLAFETAASFYNAFFGVRVPADIVRQLYGVFGQPVVLPVFVFLPLIFVAIAPLKPFYVISGWFEVFMHVRLLFHGFIICLIYFGPPREYFSRQSA